MCVCVCVCTCSAILVCLFYYVSRHTSKRMGMCTNVSSVLIPSICKHLRKKHTQVNKKIQPRPVVARGCCMSFSNSNSAVAIGKCIIAGAYSYVSTITPRAVLTGLDIDDRWGTFLECGGVNRQRKILCCDTEE